MLGVVNDDPVATDTPPTAATYHIAVPVVQVTSNVTVPVPQIAAGVVVGAVAFPLTVAVTGALPDSQPSADLQLT